MKTTLIIFLGICICLSMSSMVFTTNSAAHFDLKNYKSTEINDVLISEGKDTIPKNEIESLSEKQFSVKKDTLGFEVLTDIEFNARVKKSDKDLQLSLLTVFLGILTLFTASFLGPLAFLGLFGFFVAGAVFSIRGFKYSKIKALHFILLFLQTFVILIGLGIFIATLFS
jgi:hypothetical protein